jgi:hypothetical protein
MMNKKLSKALIKHYITFFNIKKIYKYILKLLKFTYILKKIT